MEPIRFAFVNKRDDECGALVGTDWLLIARAILLTWQAMIAERHVTRAAAERTFKAWEACRQCG